jgi:hypothetical protein
LKCKGGLSHLHEQDKTATDIEMIMAFEFGKEFRDEALQGLILAE